MVAATRGLIAGASVIFWAFGTWLIPPLVAAGVWRHVVHRIPLRYEAAMWSVVFPLGMYGVGGHFLGEADRLPIVRDIGANESWVALAAWMITFVAMLWHGWRSLVRPAEPLASVARGRESEEPADLPQNRRSAGPSISSGGGI